MSNKILKFANEIRLAAKELEIEAAKQDIYLGDKDDDNSELSQYRMFLTRLSTKPDLVPYLEFFDELMKLNLKTSIIRNTVVNNIQKKIDNITEIQKAKKNTKPSIVNDSVSNEPLNNSSINNIMTFLKKFENKKEFKDFKKHPVYKLIKEILNYLVVKGVFQFGLLLTKPNRFKQTFSAQKEKQQLQNN